MLAMEVNQFPDEFVRPQRVNSNEMDKIPLLKHEVNVRVNALSELTIKRVPLIKRYSIDSLQSGVVLVGIFGLVS